MTLPASGTLTLLQVKTEFGGPGNLIAYHRGGTYVANTSTNQSIPTSGTIRLEQFYGAAKGNVTVVTTGYQYSGGIVYAGFGNGYGSVSPTTIAGHTLVQLGNQSPTSSPSNASVGGLYLGIYNTANSQNGIFNSLGMTDQFGTYRSFTLNSTYMSYGYVGSANSAGNTSYWYWGADDSGNNHFVFADANTGSVSISIN